MYLKAIISTLAAWFVGLLIDVNLGSGDCRCQYPLRRSAGLSVSAGTAACAGHGALYPQRTEKEVRNGEPF